MAGRPPAKAKEKEKLTDDNAPKESTEAGQAAQPGSYRFVFCWIALLRPGVGAIRVAPFSIFLKWAPACSADGRAVFEVRGRFVYYSLSRTLRTALETQVQELNELRFKV